MSRTPPASIRLTSGSLNYDQVAASTYYYQSHLKEGLSLENVVRMLAYNVGFLTARQKRKEVPLIVMGVLPIYSQLRAKKWYHRYLSKSVYWFTTKLFRGAHCDRLHYHNSKIYKQGQELSPLAPRLEREEKQRQLAPNFCRKKSKGKTIKKNDVNEGTDVLRKLAACMQKKSQDDPYNNGTWRCKFRQKSAFSRRGKKHGKDYKGTSSIKRHGDIFPSLQAQRQEAGSSNNDKLSVSPFGGLLKKENRPFLHHYTKCFVDSLFTIRKKKGYSKIKKINRKPYQRSALLPLCQLLPLQKQREQRPGAWQKKNLFTIFCLEQMIGKTAIGNCFRPMRGDSITKIFTNRNKKKLKTFYDVQIIRQLTPDCHLKIRKGYSIPRSQIDKLKPILMDQDGRRVTFTSPLRHSKLSHAPSALAFTARVIQCLDFNRCVRQSKMNVTPKFCVSRQFNAQTKLNLFSIVEGRYCRGGHESATSFQRDSPQPSYYAGWKRLKSSFVFEFDVFSNNDTKNLRPTVSLRF